MKEEQRAFKNLLTRFTRVSSTRCILQKDWHPYYQQPTYSSMALFQLITYPEMANDSRLTTWTFPRSVPMYSHLLWNGKWQNVILQQQKQTENSHRCKTRLSLFCHVHRYCQFRVKHQFKSPGMPAVVLCYNEDETRTCPKIQCPTLLIIRPILNSPVASQLIWIKLINYQQGSNQNSLVKISTVRILSQGETVFKIYKKWVS